MPKFSWHTDPVPAGLAVRQVYGFLFVPDGRLLIRLDGTKHTLPGGRPEPGEVAYVDILQNPEIRANLPKYANWPTFPQLWVGGELVGGSDILTEMYEKGELQTLIKDAVSKAGA